jgi:hypothetical protein
MAAPIGDDLTVAQEHLAVTELGDLGVVRNDDQGK